MVKALRVSIYQLHRFTSTFRIPAVLVMIGCFLLENLRAVLEFSRAVEVPVTPYAFPHLTNDFICQMVIMAGAVVIFCDAPFEGKGTQYMLTRTGKFSWALGQICYIILMSFLYVTFIFFLSVMPFWRDLELSAEWGKIWGTLAKTNAGMQFGVSFAVTEYMVSHFQPLQALFLSLILEWACVVWIGLVIYALNLLTLRPVGTISGAFIILLDICIANDWVNWANRFSPITLAQINSYTGWNLRYGITFLYGCCFFAVGISVLTVLSIVINYRDRIRHRLLSWEEKWKR